MAQGIDNSKAVISLISKQYEDSENCHREYLYAQRKVKLQIPVIVNQDYMGDG